MVLATVLNIDEKAQARMDKTAYFDTDSGTVICDNSANTHICNDKRMFTELRPLSATNSIVATIGGKNSVPDSIGTVKWSWKDDNGHQHTHFLQNVLYFPNSPVNILSVTEFANALNDDEGTGIDTKRTKSRFYWDKGQYERTFLHSTSNLPEMSINKGVSSFSWFTRACARKVDDVIQCTCCCTSKL